MIVSQRVLVLVAAVAGTATAWTTHRVSRLAQQRRPAGVTAPRFLTTDVPESSSNSEELVDVDELRFESEEHKKKAVGNLVADDEWEGLTLELTDLVRKSCTSSIRESVCLKSTVCVCVCVCFGSFGLTNFHPLFLRLFVFTLRKLHCDSAGRYQSQRPRLPR